VPEQLKSLLCFLIRRLRISLERECKLSGRSGAIPGLGIRTPEAEFQNAPEIVKASASIIALSFFLGRRATVHLTSEFRKGEVLGRLPLMLSLLERGRREPGKRMF
jgi:hypothetical protein